MIGYKQFQDLSSASFTQHPLDFQTHCFAWQIKIFLDYFEHFLLELRIDPVQYEETACSSPFTSSWHCFNLAPAFFFFPPNLEDSTYSLIENKEYLSLDIQVPFYTCPHGLCWHMSFARVRARSFISLCASYSCVMTHMGTQ